MPQLEASLTDDSRGINYDRNLFILPTPTQAKHLKVGTL